MQLFKQTSYWHGIRDALPFLLVIAPFGLLFGVVATESGLNLTQAMAMTFLVVAGASQFAATQLLADHAPALVAIATGITINLRMLMYSASIAPHIGEAPLWKRALLSYLLVDQSYASSINYYEQNPALSTYQKTSYFFGLMSFILPAWLIASYIGAVAGEAIPPQYALDFAVPITFIALIGPSLKSLPHVVAALVSIVVALTLAWLPYNLGLMLAAVVAMVCGAGTEVFLRKHHERT